MNFHCRQGKSKMKLTQLTVAQALLSLANREKDIDVAIISEPCQNYDGSETK